MKPFTCVKCGAVNGGKKSKHKPIVVGAGKIICCGHCGTINKGVK